ncbi:magnesium chelatase subunit ChlI family protein [Geodermatophilus sp. URMC 65]
MPGAAGAGGQPLPVRQCRRRRRLQLQHAGAPALPGPALRALLDCIDLRVDLPAVTRAAWLEAGTAPEPTAVVADRVAQARAAAAARLSGTGLDVNSQVPGRLLRERWSPPRSALHLVERALERGAVGARLRPRARGDQCNSLAELKLTIEVAGDLQDGLRGRHEVPNPPTS